VVRENPYRLALDVFGIGFKSADRIAESIGIERDSPRRAEAGTLHALTELAGEGHLFCPRLQLIELASSTLEIDRDLVEDAVPSLADSGHIRIERTEDDDIVYLQSLHIAEMGAAESLTRLLHTAANPVRIDPDRAIAQFERTHQIELAQQQRGGAQARASQQGARDHRWAGNRQDDDRQGAARASVSRRA
jgi:exodeoxyribonuclease V alpha subunit